MAARKKEGPEKTRTKPAAGTRAMREAAEKKLGELKENSPGPAGQTPGQLVHELQVHQIELQMQAEELRRAHLELSESRDKLLDLYDFSPNGYLTLTDKALIQEVNLAGALLLGVERSRLVRARFRKFITQHDLSLWDRYFTNILNQEEKQKCTLTLIRGDGSMFPARLESIRIPGREGESTVRITISDITDIWQIEALKESDERFRKIFENSPIGMVLITPDFRFFSVNPAWVAMTGYTEKELLRMSFTDVTHPDHLAGDREHMQELVAGTIPVYHTEKRYIRKDGSFLWGLIRVTPIRDPQGSLAYFAAQIEDITERKQDEVAIRDLNDYNRSLFEASIDPLVTINSEGKIQDVNAATKTVTGSSREELVGSDFSNYFTEPKNARDGYLQVFADGKVLDYPLKIRHRDGHITPVLYNATVYHDRDGKIKGVFAAARDITERKRAEAVRESLMDELTRKNTELDRFTYTVSHDLKSPLLSIRAFLALLEMDMKAGNSEKVQTDILRITESAKKLEQLVTTLLALSRCGRTVEAPARLVFTDIAHEAAGLLDATLRNHRVTLVIPDLMPFVSGDRQRLVQVMTNLLDNAIKFMGDQKEPRIEIGAGDDCGTPVFFVKDNGMGIARDNLPKVFGLYERFNPEVPGTGIGLATVKRIIEAHGGKIWVESEGPGKGSMFRFTLPGVAGAGTDNNNTR